MAAKVVAAAVSENNDAIVEVGGIGFDPKLEILVCWVWVSCG